MPTALPPRLAVIGGGNMATAIIKSLAGLPQAPAVTVSEPDAAKREIFAAQGHAAVASNAEAVAAADVVLLAIKPQMAAVVLSDLSKGWSDKKLLISILAGTPTAKLEAGLAQHSGCRAPRVVRAMPNTPLAIGLGMVGICPGRNAGAADLVVAEALFAPCAKVLRCDESRMDAITAVSGSGPAYFFRFAEALVNGAMQLGFSRDEAVLLVGTTGTGSWQYLLQSGFEAAKLREQVTSPGGTTAAALNVINDGGFEELWAKALAAAEARGRELAQG
jgi:pyrroline-5-carboxylate reductase